MSYDFSTSATLQSIWTVMRITKLYKKQVILITFQIDCKPEQYHCYGVVLLVVEIFGPELQFKPKPPWTEQQVQFQVQGVNQTSGSVFSSAKCQLCWMHLNLFEQVWMGKFLNRGTVSKKSVEVEKNHDLRFPNKVMGMLFQCAPFWIYTKWESHKDILPKWYWHSQCPTWTSISCITGTLLWLFWINAYSLVVLCWLGLAWKLSVKLGFLWPWPSKTKA